MQSRQSLWWYQAIEEIVWQLGYQITDDQRRRLGRCEFIHTWSDDLWCSLSDPSHKAGLLSWTCTSVMKQVRRNERCLTQIGPVQSEEVTTRQKNNSTLDELCIGHFELKCWKCCREWDKQKGNKRVKTTNVYTSLLPCSGLQCLLCTCRISPSFTSVIRLNCW